MPIDSPKKRGRPLKNRAKDSWELARTVIVIDAFHTARKQGQKHTSAIQDTVDFVRQHYPDVPISPTGVRRILAELQPANSEMTLIVESSTPSDDDVARRLRLREQIPGFGGNSSATNSSDRRSKKTFKLRFGKRPHYSRHNAKVSPI
jgi:hypothetical protein